MLPDFSRKALIIITLAATQGRNLHQMDVKIAFLHGAIKEEVYVEQPLGSKSRIETPMYAG